MYTSPPWTGSDISSPASAASRVWAQGELIVSADGGPCARRPRSTQRSRTKLCARFFVGSMIPEALYMCSMARATFSASSLHSPLRQRHTWIQALSLRAIKTGAPATTIVEDAWNVPLCYLSEHERLSSSRCSCLRIRSFTYSLYKESFLFRQILIYNFCLD